MTALRDVIQCEVNDKGESWLVQLLDGEGATVAMVSGLKSQAIANSASEWLRIGLLRNWDALRLLTPEQCAAGVAAMHANESDIDEGLPAATDEQKVHSIFRAVQQAIVGDVHRASA